MRQDLEKDIALNMIGLAELLQSAQENAFTVVFMKQATEENAMAPLLNADNVAYKDPKKLAQLAKEIITGANCTVKIP